MRAVDGDRENLAEILAGIGDMPGCHSYQVALEESDPHALWVTEVWESADAHAASLQLPDVVALIEKGRPLIVGFESRVETRPIGGLGLDV